MFNQKDIKSKKNELSESDFKARRRLLKASAAAPLIVTLSPNAALAQGSLTCAQKNAADTGLPNYPLFRGDTHLRSLREHRPMQEFMARLKGEWNTFRSFVES